MPPTPPLEYQYMVGIGHANGKEGGEALVKRETMSS